MFAPDDRRPWDAAEMRARALAGGPEIAPVIRTFLDDPLPEFFARLSMIFVAGLDAQSRPAASLLRGARGFVSAPDARHLEIAADFPQGEAISVAEGAPFALIGVDFTLKWRNRVNGRLRPAAPGRIGVAVEEAFGNCPKFIMQRKLSPLAAPPGAWTELAELDAAAREAIAGCDCFFIASRGAANMDMSHRGGPPGFVEFFDGATLRVPDFRGNNYYNTFGNLLDHPQAALLFPDFATGRLLHLSGRAEVDFAARAWSFHIAAARRLTTAPLIKLD